MKIDKTVLKRVRQTDRVRISRIFYYNGNLNSRFIEIGYRLSVIGYQLSVIGYRLSIISYQYKCISISIVSFCKFIATKCIVYEGQALERWHNLDEYVTGCAYNNKLVI